MNNWNGIGNCVADPELKFISGSGKAVCTLKIAVQRPYVKDKTDFFEVTTWQGAEWVANNIKKGEKIAVSGYIYCDPYENKEGKKVYPWRVNGTVEKLQWEKKEEKEEGFMSLDEDTLDGFQAIEEDDFDSGIPF